MFKTFSATFLFFFSVHCMAGEPPLRVEVAAGDIARNNLPVSLPVDELGGLSIKNVRLVEIVDGKRVEKPFQVIAGPEARVYWKLDGISPPGSKRIFEFEKGKPAKAPSAMADKEADDLVLRRPDNTPLLTYRYTVKAPPAGVDPAYGRGGYIHPLFTPSGKVLTRIQAPDHYHHYGLWNPWTHVGFEGKQYDLWNLGDHKGTVRFVKFAQIDQGPVSAGFDAVHDHIIFNDGREESIISEDWKIRVFPVGNDRYLCDITSVLHPTPKADVTLEEYRYGGLGLRFTEQFNSSNSRVQTSSGKTWKDADGSPERWAIVSGDLGGSQGGVLFMSFPENYNYPEPVRVWPENMNGRGDQFFNFSPTKNKDWVLKAGQTYTLKYRLLVFDGTLTAAEAESCWQSFAHPPVISVTKR